MSDAAPDPRLTAAIEAGAKAFHDAARDKKFLRWETSSEEYRAEIRALLRPAIEAAVAVGYRHDDGGFDETVAGSRTILDM